MKETTPELIEALRVKLSQALGLDTIDTYAMNTGGGVMVAMVDLSQDGRGIGRQVWLTRDDDWLLGFYDFAADPEDEGVCVSLMLSENDRDLPDVVAGRVAAILSRLGVTLQGA